MLATLLFWGWQSGFLPEGAIMGVLFESPRYIRRRWELDDADFHRIFSFCVLLNVLLMGYMFTNNDEGGGPGALFHGDPRAFVNSGANTGTRFIRWLPMTLFPFIIVQIFNVRDSVPLTAVSLALRWRRRKGDWTLAGKYLNVSYAYFIICLLAAGIHLNAGTHSYFWGQAVLVTWALWSLRSARFQSWVWVCSLVVAVGLGFLGQFSIGLATVYLQNFNAQWMGRLFRPHTDATRSLTSMGQIGSLKMSAEIVVWLEPHMMGRAPSYLREASYRTYHPIRREWYAPHTDFEAIPSEVNSTSYVLLADQKTNPPAGKETVNETCFLNERSEGLPAGLLPLPSGIRRLDNLPDVVLAVNSYGAVLAKGPGLLVFDDTYAANQTIDSPPDDSTNRFDLQVATNDVPALQAAIAEMGLTTNADLATKLREIDRFFLDKFTYSTWQNGDKQPTNGLTSLTRFLTTSRSGHCEYFATATVLLLRKLDVPARYAVGYAVHETSGSGYVVRERDAHAWCLVWNKARHQWTDFDTTPPSWVAIESRRSHFWEWFADFKSWLRFQFAAFRYRQAHLQQYIFWALVPVMVVLLYYIIFRRRGNLKAKPKGAGEAAIFWPGLDSEFFQLEKKLTGFGLPRQPGEALSFWLERVSTASTLATLRDPLQKLLRLHYRHRFDPQGLDTDEREQLRREAKSCLDSLLTPHK